MKTTTSRERKMWSQRLKLWVIVGIVQLLVIAVQCDNFNKLKRPKTISEVQTEYLSNEENLWQWIDSVLAQNSSDDYDAKVNETWIKALKAHRIVFFDDTFDINSYWRSYLLFRIGNFREYLSNINGTLEANYRYLFDENNDKIQFDPADINLWTHESMFQQLKENSDSLLNLTVIHTDTVLKNIQNEAKCCTRYVNYVISEAQLVREYYANVGKALLRSYAMTQLAYMLTSLSQQRNLHAKANDERNLYLERYSLFHDAVESLLAVASRDLWKCNPNPYLDSRTYYTSITNFIQGYIDNEINLNDEQTCGGTCNDYESTKHHHCQDYTICDHSNFKRTKCTGNIFDCSTIDSDGVACLVKEEWENRRYNYVTFQNGSMNGHSVLCFKAEQSDLKQPEHIPNECENCFCFCDEPGKNSDRYISLRELTSDIAANKIITGIAIKKIDRVIQLMISERVLYAFGKVNDTLRRTQIWKNNNIAFLKDGEKNIDYFTLTREHRTINLDTLVVPLGKVVTGIRFQAHENRLHLEIRATDFDYETGQLKNLEQSAWINNLHTEQRAQINILDPDSPTRTTKIQEPVDSHNKFIEFRPTDIKKDLAQLTVPYFESVPLEASEPKPLSGVGLYYKGEAGYGGFISLKLIAYDTGIL